MSTNKTESAMDFLNSLTGGKLTFGSLLLSIRKCDELSQVVFAKQLGISRQNLCDIEHDRRAVSPKKASNFAEILGYSSKQFVRICLQDQLDRDGIDLTVNVETNIAA